MKSKLLREQEAKAFIDSLKDPITRRLVELPYQEVLRRFHQNERLPVEDFDLLYFIEGTFRSFSCDSRIFCCLDGIDYRWFPDEDDEILNASFCPMPPPEREGQRMLRRHQANWFLGFHSADTAVNNIAGIALFAVMRHKDGRPFPGELCLPGREPLAAVDMQFCAEVLVEIASQKDILREIQVDRQSRPATETRFQRRRNPDDFDEDLA